MGGNETLAIDGIISLRRGRNERGLAPALKLFLQNYGTREVKSSGKTIKGKIINLKKPRSTILFNVYLKQCKHQLVISRLFIVLPIIVLPFIFVIYAVAKILF